MIQNNHVSTNITGLRCISPHSDWLVRKLRMRKWNENLKYENYSVTTHTTGMFQTHSSPRAFVRILKLYSSYPLLPWLLIRILIFVYFLRYTASYSSEGDGILQALGEHDSIPLEKLREESDWSFCFHNKRITSNLCVDHDEKWIVCSSVVQVRLAS